MDRWSTFNGDWSIFYWSNEACWWYRMQQCVQSCICQCANIDQSSMNTDQLTIGLLAQISEGKECEHWST